ncbi:MAG: response regulator, partial [Actinomycetia bacterium]|nr:response regulator [Actinomycetes bacterium]
VIDDSKASVFYLKKLFEKQGYTVFTASNGKDGLLILSKNSVDLILLDIEMPEMNGFEVLKEIINNKKTKEIPVIMITSRTDADDVKKALGNGAIDYVKKPLNRIELLARLRTTLRLSRQKRAILKYNQDIKRELDAAKKLQQLITAPTLIESENYRIYSRYLSCDEMAGDYLNVFRTNEKVYIVLADATGHGLLASFYTFILHENLKNGMEKNMSIQDLIYKVNEDIKKFFLDAFFLTLGIFEIDPKKNTLNFLLAGHPEFMIFDDKDITLYFQPGKLISKFTENYMWETEKVQLKENDRILIFTDGLIENFDDQERMLDINYLKKVTEELRNEPSKSFIEKMLHKVKNDTNGHIFRDDVSICIYEKNCLII